MQEGYRQGGKQCRDNVSMETLSLHCFPEEEYPFVAGKNGALTKKHQVDYTNLPDA
jgi:hypothetical protein